MFGIKKKKQHIFALPKNQQMRSYLVRFWEYKVLLLVSTFTLGVFILFCCLMYFSVFRFSSFEEALFLNNPYFILAINDQWLDTNDTNGNGISYHSTFFGSLYLLIYASLFFSFPGPSWRCVNNKNLKIKLVRKKVPSGNKSILNILFIKPMLLILRIVLFFFIDLMSHSNFKWRVFICCKQNI